MRLYLEAESKNKVGYTPDWLRVSYYKNGDRMELTLDIQGEVNYIDKCLSCRCKGYLIPWGLYNCESGDEIDLYSLSDEQIEDILPHAEVARIICESEDYEIGIYPVTNGNDEIFERAKTDVVSDGKGSFEIFVDDENYYRKDFEFEVEVNIY